MILNCSSSLQGLDLSGTDIVSLPTSIKTFVGLKLLILEDCKRLQEILDLPPNISKVYASGCISLETFPEVSKRFLCNTSDSQTLHWIDLSGCHKMHVDIENHVPKPPVHMENL